MGERTTTVLLAALLLMGTSACEQAHAVLGVLDDLVGKVLPDPRFEPRTTPTDADFVISGDDVRYKGQRVPLLEDVEKVIQIFGSNYRKRDERLYVWDDLGVYCFRSSFSNRAINIGIRMRNYPDSPIWTKQLYQKDIVVDGAVINRDSQAWQFNKNKEGEQFRNRAVMYHEYFRETTVAGILTNLVFSIQVDTEGQVHDFNVYVTCGNQC